MTEVPDWVICPKDYEALLAEYALLKLTDTGNIDLERWTRMVITTGRMNAADCKVPLLDLTYPHHGVCISYIRTLSSACRKVEEYWTNPTRRSNCGGRLYLTSKVHRHCLQNAMETSVRLFLSREGLVDPMLNRLEAGAHLVKYPQREKKELPLPTEEVMRWLRTIHPRCRAALELKWVNWGIVRSLPG